MKVIHLPTPTGGNAWGLSRGERRLGITSDVLYKENSWLDYPADIILPQYSSRILKNINKLSLFVNLLRKYDVFHYNFGRSLFDWPGSVDLLELSVLKNKRVFVTYNGCDARQKYGRILQAEITCCKFEDCNGGACSGIAVDQLKQKRIKKFDKIQAGFFAVNPDIMRFLPNRTIFLPYTVAGWERLTADSAGYQIRKPIRIVHAPTNRVIKGTDAVIQSINSIERKHPGSVELILVEGIPHEKALDEYRKADLVIDQLRIGWYGGLAVEVMKMGIPVIAYINYDDLCFIPPQMAKECQEAIINANEYTLEEVLLHYIDNPNELIAKQKAQLEYVNKWHNPRYVASITKRQYEQI